MRFLTAGESHGKALVGILEGLPAGLELGTDDINAQLRRRQGGYGRGARMRLANDEVEIVAGLWRGRSTGAPLALMLANGGQANPEEMPARSKPRPGHADYAGAVKYSFQHDLNAVSERASARETAMRVAIGAVAMKLMREFGVEVFGHVLAIGGLAARPTAMGRSGLRGLRRRRDGCPFYCLDARVRPRFQAAVDAARRAGDTLGGIVEIRAFGVPPGLGSYAQFDRRLDARLAFHMLSIPSCKGVEIGDGIESAKRTGSGTHDPLLIERGCLRRPSNRAGGIDGGVSNGEPVVARAFFKPIPTLRKPLATVDLKTGAACAAPYLRSDTVVLPAASVIAESLTAFVLAEAFLERFGGDTVVQARRAYGLWKRENPRCAT
ncbi:MAG: chorismate synthase [Elusimicrobia bacterium]|nr:chorismate synthase [Elusimicrobiota bacterium]